MPEPSDAVAPTTAPTVFAIPPRLRHDPEQRRLFGTLLQMACPLCDGQVPFAPRVRRIDCPSCSTPLVRGPDDHTPLAPGGLIRFAIAPAAVPELAKAGITRWGAARPHGAVLTSFERVYVPIWRFTTHVVCSWEWVDKDNSSNAHRGRESGEFTDDYDQQVVASTDVHHELLALLEDLPLAAAVPFTPDLLDGARVLPVNVPVQDAWLKARVHFDDEAMAGTTGSLEYSAMPHWSREEGALILVPAYLGREETRSVSTPVLVDGVTGQVYGGIGNRPFVEPAGPVANAVVYLFLVAVLGAVAWGVFKALSWLGG